MPASWRCRGYQPSFSPDSLLLLPPFFYFSVSFRFLFLNFSSKNTFYFYKILCCFRTCYFFFHPHRPRPLLFPFFFQENHWVIEKTVRRQICHIVLLNCTLYNTPFQQDFFFVFVLIGCMCTRNTFISQVFLLCCCQYPPEVFLPSLPLPKVFCTMTKKKN